MKKAVSILLCLVTLLCGGVNAFATVSPVPMSSLSPRFKNILYVSRTITNNGDSIACMAYCDTASPTTIKITVTLKDTSGKTISSKSGQEAGTDSYRFKTNFDVTPGKTYQIVFDYDAGGERTSNTKIYTV